MNSKTAIFRLSKVKENMSDTDKIKCLAGNTGNMVFDNALGSIIKGDDVYTYTVSEALNKYDRFVTTSYIWIRQNEPINTMFSKIGNKPYIPMSVGIQAADYDKNFVLYPSVANELKEVSERCVIGCRGYYTAEILNKYGIKNTMVIGCPSLYTHIFSGNDILKKEYSEISRCAVNFITFWRSLKKHEQDFLRFAYNNGMTFVEQTENKPDRAWLGYNSDFTDKILKWINSGKMFYTYREWSEFIKTCDFSLGYRFHGNVIALNNEVPALFVYSDSRVRELCEFFKLPSVKAEKFDISRPLEYWYEKADYSEFNKYRNEYIKNFKEFCRKNSLEIDFEKKDSEQLDDKNAKAEINSVCKAVSSKSTAEERKEEKTDLSEKNTDTGSHILPAYEHSRVWKRIEFEGKNIFIADGKTIWQHLKILLPEKLESQNEYFISFKTKFKTSNEGVRFFIQNSKGDFQQLCCQKNRYIDDYYDISACFSADSDYEFLRVTSSDFVGDNYFAVSDIEIKKLTVKINKDDSTIKDIISDLALYAECSHGFGSLLDYFIDTGENQFSLYCENDSLMKAFHAMAHEASLSVYMDISSHKFSCRLGYTQYTTNLLDGIFDVKKISYNKNIPVLVCSDIDEQTKKKLYRLTDKVLFFKDIYSYAVSKNCVLAPICEYFKSQDTDVNIFSMYMTNVADIEQPSDYEKKIMTHVYKKQYDLIYENDPSYIDRVKNTNGPFWHGTGKQLKYIDVKNEDCIALNGIRRTFYQPEKYNNCIWFVGTSVSSGTGYVLDEHTIESFLQKILGEKMPSEYQVNNVIMPCGWHYINFYDTVKNLPVKSGDILILSNEYSQVFVKPEYFTTAVSSVSGFLDLRKYFQRPHDMGEIFFDLTHVGPKGCKRYAEAVYTELFENNKLNDLKKLQNDDEIPKELTEYLEKIKSYKKPGKNGCIVMNCNPFTSGHRYLVETASSMVDNLYIFVVEEDKSKFSFDDRIMLVLKGTEDLKNVTVLPSGKYIVSAVTFKAYFEKGEKQDVAVDTSYDLSIFGKYIAPALDISVRFAGTEPLDKVTSQYNSNMKLLLPKYGVEFCEIPRKESESGVISASLVRKLLESRDFDKISQLVPETTLEYLKDNFSD